MFYKLTYCNGVERRDIKELYTNDDPDFEFGYVLFDMSNAERDLLISVEVKNMINGYGAKLGEYVLTTYVSHSIQFEVIDAAVDDFEL